MHYIGAIHGSNSTDTNQDMRHVAETCLIWPYVSGNDVPPTVRGCPVRKRPSSRLDFHAKYIFNETNKNPGTNSATEKTALFPHVWRRFRLRLAQLGRFGVECGPQALSKP